jgi:hypothetical protein
MPISSELTWKDLFLSQKKINCSHVYLPKMKAAVGPLIPFIHSFDEILKNKGISFLSLDPSQTQLQLFHNGVIIGGSWSSPSKLLESILDFNKSAKPIQIVEKLIKDAKQKSFSAEELEFESLKPPQGQISL